MAITPKYVSVKGSSKTASSRTIGGPSKVTKTSVSAGKSGQKTTTGKKLGARAPSSRRGS